MQAIVYTAPGEFGLAPLDVPSPAPGSVRLKVAACGVCHTDIDVLHGRYGDSTYPLVPGHEYAGVVEAVGEGVRTSSSASASSSTRTCPAGVAGTASAAFATSASISARTA